MVVKCEVKFDHNPSGVYFAGQTLSGVVELTIDKPKQTQGLILKIEGGAKVEWSETRHDDNSQSGVTANSRTIFYSGQEDFISSTFYLIGNAEGAQVDLSPGHYRYNFQTVLPSHLPTSCEAPYGAIRYLCSVVLVRPFKFDLTYKVAFTVIKQLDLNNENPSLRLPLKMEAMKTFCCTFCRTRPIFLVASIPMGGFVPGQAITVSVEVNNESRVDIEDVKVSLKKIIRYSAQAPSAMTKEEVINEVEIHSGGIKRRSKENFKQYLFIPAVPPTNTNSCRVLNVSYEVRAKCIVSGSSQGPTVRLPIIIGTVPIIPLQNHNISSTPSLVEMTYDQMLGSYTPQINNNNLPPSYAEAVYTQELGDAIELSEIGEHTMGNVRPFHPMYPVYYGIRENNQDQDEVPNQQLTTTDNFPPKIDEKY